MMSWARRPLPASATDRRPRPPLQTRLLPVVDSGEIPHLQFAPCIDARCARCDGSLGGFKFPFIGTWCRRAVLVQEAASPPSPGSCGSGGGGSLAGDAGGAIDPPPACSAAPHEQSGPAVEAEPGQRRGGRPQGQPADRGLHEAGRPSASEA